MAIGRFTYHFEWDPEKARGNAAKHGVGFDLAATVFLDPLAITVYDAGHSDEEERWATLGRAENAALLVVIHAYEEANGASAAIRMISARKATRQEIRDYEQAAR